MFARGAAFLSPLLIFFTLVGTNSSFAATKKCADLLVSSKKEEKISVTRLVVAYLRENIRGTRIFEPNGVKQAFLNLALLIPDGPERNWYIKEIGSMPFAQSEYQMLMLRSPSLKAWRRMEQAWRAYLAAQKLDATTPFTEENVGQAIAILDARPKPAKMTAQKPELSLAIIVENQKWKITPAALRDLEHMGLPDQAGNIVKTYTGLTLPVGPGQASQQWTILVSRARDNGLIHSYALIAHLALDQDGVLHVLKIIEPSEENEKYFWSRLAVTKHILGQKLSLSIPREKGPDWTGEIDISSSVAAKVATKHDMDLDQIQNWMDYYYIGSIHNSRGGTAFDLEPVAGVNLPPLQMILRHESSGSYRLITIHPKHNVSIN